MKMADGFDIVNLIIIAIHIHRLIKERLDIIACNNVAIEHMYTSSK